MPARPLYDSLAGVSPCLRAPPSRWAGLTLLLYCSSLWCPGLHPLHPSSDPTTPLPTRPTRPWQTVIHEQFMGPSELAAIYAATLLNVHPPT